MEIRNVIKIPKMERHSMNNNTNYYNNPRGPDWESNFSSVLNRTRQNIDRITSKYGVEQISSQTSSINPTYNNIPSYPSSR